VHCPDPQLREPIIDTAARLLATEGRDAVSARPLVREMGASTMVVYTHLSGMDDLIRHVMGRGSTDFGIELERGTITADPVADCMTCPGRTDASHRASHTGTR
jgi:AcrR family transcriptional regulator